MPDFIVEGFAKFDEGALISKKVELFDKFEELRNGKIAFQGFKRDDKRTYVLLECGNCGASFSKEQYYLLNKPTVISINCPNCGGRRVPVVVTEDLLIKELSEYEAEFISVRREDSQIYIKFKCKCGEISEKHRRVGTTLYMCKSCEDTFFQERVPSNKASMGEVLSWFIDNGAEPLFTEYTDANTDLPFRCACGALSKMRYSRRLEGGLPRCRKCYGLSNRGENNPTYKGVPDDERKRRDGRVKTWDKDVKEAYNYTCVISGDIDELCSHHLYAWGTYPELRFEVKNGVCISRKLHQEFHQKYGYGANTLEQFKEFFQSKTGKEFIS